MAKSEIEDRVRYAFLGEGPWSAHNEPITVSDLVRLAEVAGTVGLTLGQRKDLMCRTLGVERMSDRAMDRALQLLKKKRIIRYHAGRGWLLEAV